MVRRAGVVGPIKWGALSQRSALSRVCALSCVAALSRVFTVSHACALGRALLGISLIWALGSSLLL